MLKNKIFLKLFLLHVCIVVMVSNSKIHNSRALLDFFTSPCKCRCGVPNREGRLLGGEAIGNHEFPWSSTLHLNRDNLTNKTEDQIQGTIINNKYILTAASQVLGLTPYDIKVTLGQHDRCVPETFSINSSVEKIILHPDFLETNGAHDLALIKLNIPITIERRISPVCLSTPNTKYLGQVATMFGWHHEINDSLSCIPKKLGLPILEQRTCLNYLKNKDTYLQDKSCAGVVGTRSPICSTDAGGPVLFRSYTGIYELIGILSDRNDCNDETNLAYYSNINDHLSWITRNTRDACYCFKT